MGHIEAHLFVCGEWAKIRKGVGAVLGAYLVGVWLRKARPKVLAAAPVPGCKGVG